MKIFCSNDSEFNYFIEKIVDLVVIKYRLFKYLIIFKVGLILLVILVNYYVRNDVKCLLFLFFYIVLKNYGF